METLKFERPTMYPPATSGDMWELAKDWLISYKGEDYLLPAGFMTDGASIPRFLWRVCGTPLKTPRLYAALVHDFIYGGGDPDATRKDADTIYRDLQLVLIEQETIPPDYGWFKRTRAKCRKSNRKRAAWTEYYALRLCGKSHWCGNPELADK